MSSTEKKTDLTLALVGVQGSGKSATGNTIVGGKCFPTGMGTKSSTTQVKIETVKRGQKYISIIDTPALSSKEFSLRRQLTEEQQDTLVYAVVITIGRFTPEERDVVERFLSGNEYYFRTIKPRKLLIFTRKKELEQFECTEEEELNTWLETTPSIRKWISQYKLKYFAIENSSKENDRVIDEMIKCAVSMIPYEEEKVSLPSAGQHSSLDRLYGFLNIMFGYFILVILFVRYIIRRAQHL